jgi:hypothetical protein
MARITPAIEARVRALSAAGMSSRKISGQLASENTNLSHTAIAELLRLPASPAALEVMARPGGGGVAPAKPGRPSAEERAAEARSEQERPQSDQERPLRTSVEIDPEAPLAEVIQKLHNRLAEISGIADAARNEKNFTLFRQMVELEFEHSKRLTEITPDPPVKPEDDPANVTARDLVRARILDATEDSEEQRGDLCPRCMQHRSAA